MVEAKMTIVLCRGQALGKTDFLVRKGPLRSFDVATGVPCDSDLCPPRACVPGGLESLQPAEGLSRGPPGKLQGCFRPVLDWGVCVKHFVAPLRKGGAAAFWLIPVPTVPRVW